MRGRVKLLLAFVLLVTGCLPDSCFDCDDNGDADCVANNNPTGGTGLPTPTPAPPLTLQCRTLNSSPEAELEWELGIGGGTAPYAYTVDFGDETTDATGSWGGVGSPPRGFHDYERPGDFQVRGDVRDASGRTQSCVFAYAAPAPDLSLRCNVTPTTGTAPLTVRFEIPPGGRTGCIGPCTVTWYFGDGEIHEGGQVVHEYVFPGPTAQSTYAAFAELRDGLDRVTQCRAPVQVLSGPVDPSLPTNQPPSISGLAASPASITAGQSATITGHTHDPNLGDTVSWQLTFDSSGAGTLSPMSGTGAIASTYTSSSTTSGTVVIRAGVVDNHGLPGPYSTVHVSVTPSTVNQPPVIVSLTASPAVVFPGGAPSQIAAVITDPNGDPISWTLELDPASTAAGTLSATSGGGNASSAFSASPPPNQGVAVIRLTARDPGGLTATQTVNVNVALGKH